jgi:peptidoglycan hydrolase-like protein with peptidoglycan-binding domain
MASIVRVFLLAVAVATGMASTASAQDILQQILRGVIEQGARRAPGDRVVSRAGADERKLGPAQRKQIQQALKARGLLTGKADGQFGAGTRRAIGAFQAGRDERATGYLTRNQIADLLSASNASPQTAFASSRFELLRGYDLPGNDLAKAARGVSLEQCEASCAANAACTAFTYNTEYAACIQKSAAATPKPFGTAISGRRTQSAAPAQMQVAAGFELFENADMPGGDYRSGLKDPSLKGIDFDTCRSICAADPVCKSVTHFNNTCMLKSTTSRPLPFTGAMSAKKNWGPGISAAERDAPAGRNAALPTADLAWRDDDSEQSFVARLRAAAKPMGGDCKKERLAFSAIADGISFAAIEPAGIAGSAITFAWTRAGKMASFPAYIMVTADQPVRFEGTGYYALLPKAIAPFGLSVAKDQTRAIVALYGAGVQEKGAIKVIPLVAGPLKVTAMTVGYFRACEEEVLREAATTIVAVRPSPTPTFFVNDPFSLDAPKHTLVNTTGTRHAQILEGRYRLIDAQTGAVLAEREGKDINFSPTGRFLAAFNGDELDVVDAVDGEFITKTYAQDIGWENSDSFLVAGAHENNNWGTVTTLQSTNPALSFRNSPDCRICPGIETSFRLDLENNVAQTGGAADGILELLSGTVGNVAPEGSKEPTSNAIRANLESQYAADAAIAPLSDPPQWDMRHGSRFSHLAERSFSDNGGEVDKRTAQRRKRLVPSAKLEPPSALASTETLAGMPSLVANRAAIALDDPAPMQNLDADNYLRRLGVRFSPAISATFRAGYNGQAPDDEGIARQIQETVPKAKGKLGRKEAASVCVPTDQSEVLSSFTNALQFNLASRTIWLTNFECAEGTAQHYTEAFTLFDSAAADPIVAVDGNHPVDSSNATSCASNIGYCSFDARLYGDRYLLIWSVASRAIMIYDIDARKPVYKNFNLGRGDLFKEAFYSLEDRMVTQVNNDGSFFVYDVDANKQVLEGRYVDDELIAWAPNLRFDATAEGASYVNLRFPGQSVQYTFQQFAAKVRQPGLVTSVFDRAGIAPTIDVGLPPQVEGSLKTEGDRITGAISLTTGAAGGEVAIFQDGLRTDTITVADQPSVPIDVVRAPGARWVSVLASDRGGLASLPVGRDLGKPSALPVVRALAIGIDEYTSLPALKFGAADARTLIASLAAQHGKTINLTSSQILDRKGLTRATLLDAIQTLVDGARPGETIVFSYAGHGLTAPSGGFYMSTSLTDVSDIAGTSVAWSEVAAILAKAKARVLVFLDACHSGTAGTDYFASNDDAAAGVLARIPSGLVVFSASKGRQLSLETSDAGGGVFTNAVADVIARKRTTFDTNRNGAIEISELYAGVKLRVVGQTGGRQTPWLSRNEMVGDFALF